MATDRCDLVASSGLPVVVIQALDDRRLAPASQRVMWKLRLLLDFFEYRALKAESIANLAGVKPQAAGRALAELTDAGYLDREPGKSKPGCYRMPWSRRAIDESTLRQKVRGRPQHRRGVQILIVKKAPTGPLGSL